MDHIKVSASLCYQESNLHLQFQCGPLWSTTYAPTWTVEKCYSYPLKPYTSLLAPQNENVPLKPSIHTSWQRSNDAVACLAPMLCNFTGINHNTWFLREALNSVPPTYVSTMKMVDTLVFTLVLTHFLVAAVHTTEIRIHDHLKDSFLSSDR